MDNKYDSWPKEKLVKRIEEIENYNEELRQSLAASNNLFLNEFKWYILIADDDMYVDKQKYKNART